MRAFRDLSIKRKLTLMIMLISGVALLLACVATVTYDQIILRQVMARDLSVTADIIAANETAALTFNDPVSSQEDLDALSAKLAHRRGVSLHQGRPALHQVCAFRPERRLLAAPGQSRRHLLGERAPGSVPGRSFWMARRWASSIWSQT